MATLVVAMLARTNNATVSAASGMPATSVGMAPGVDVINDNNIVYSREPKQPTNRVTFQFQDAQPDPGVHYYCARVIQKDRNMAWISPIWVNVGEK